jgi:hypothetical protein
MDSTLGRYDKPLAVSRSVLRALIKLNVLVGFLVLALLIASLAAGPLMRVLGVQPTADGETQILGMRGLTFIGVLALLLLHVVYTRLLAIVETVKAGEPFVAENAARVQTIAWAFIGLELLHIGVHIVLSIVAARSLTGMQNHDNDYHFSVTGTLAILLLFVLARVFDQGARMRDELAAMV